MSVAPVPSSSNSSIYIAKKFVTDICLFLKNNNNLTDIIPIKNCLHNLSDFYSDLTSFRGEIARTLLENDFHFLASSILQKISQKGYFQNDDIWFTVYCITFLLMNFSDCSYDFATSILDTEIPNLLILNLLHEPYRKDLGNEKVYYLLLLSLGIINNITRNFEKVTLFRRDDIKQALLEFIRINDSNDIGIISMLNLANLVNESELHLLEEGKNTIKIFIGKILAAKAKNPSTIDGFAMWELINGLKQIVLNDNMKKAFVRENGINVIIDILKNPTCDEDIKHSLGVICNLCFDSDIRNDFNKTYKVKNIIKRYSNHKNLNINKSYDGIICLLDQRKISVESVKPVAVNKNETGGTSNWKFDIFLSYSWANKQDVFMIRDELIKNNLKVWIDVDQIKGSTLDSMSNGIENSKLFIMAVSEAYRSSPNCRTEAEYAFSLKKPLIPIMLQSKFKPGGWLGLLIGAKVYYEFSGRRNFVETMRNLLRDIQRFDDHLDDIKSTVIQPLTQDKRNSLNFQSTLKTSSNSKISEIKKWQKKDVDAWFDRCKLRDIKCKLNSLSLTGENLLLFIDMQKNCPDYLYKKLSKDYNINLTESMLLNEALSKLNL